MSKHEALPAKKVLPPLAAAYAPPDEPIAALLLAQAPRPPEAEARVDACAQGLVEAIRSRTNGLGGIEDFLHEYSLSTKEGLALMVLAEALLRVPDDATADSLIEDKLATADFPQHQLRSETLLVSASAWALGVSARIVAPEEQPEGLLRGLVRRLGQPAVRAATRRAMRLLGSHFVLGQTIGEALARAGKDEQAYSFDMLGEGARTAADAEHYFSRYDDAIEKIGRATGNASSAVRPGISVKLSALHPRYEAVSRERVLAELTPRVIDLARRAKRFDLGFTVDAEEADRLEISLEVVGRVMADPSLAGWAGFGLAVQSYQKRSLQVIDWMVAAAERLERQFMVRLVKGAYWDTEIKRAQERGLADYPVFTRKAMTDLCYTACVRRLLAARPRLYPQFATHNALTVACVIEDAGGVDGYEFQRLHGMGEALYNELSARFPQALCRVYAPVGGHRDLLAYLVRRLLENGANTSFVSVAADRSVPVAQILRRPQSWIGTPENARNPRIPLPGDLFAPRRNSRGVEFGDHAALGALTTEISSPTPRDTAAPVINGSAWPGRGRDVCSPIDGAVIGRVVEASEGVTEAAMAAAQDGFPAWAATPLEVRAQTIERAADRIEAQRGRLIALLQREGGKTLDDALAEIREATDFCRYYAGEARVRLAGTMLPGPTGETNRLCYRGRGVFVCISPWNFPLAIFTGQIVAALLAGNSVVAKPAEQTPLIAADVVALLHAAGVPHTALHLVPGAGGVGAALVSDPRTAGVAFTGSVPVAHAINRALASRQGPIVPLIAETGGINAMIVDATALLEQVTDDVVTSAFRSAGQRCSALRLLCVQDDVADHLIEMIIGAARELRVGDPRDVATHVGPVIDADAKAHLDRWIERMRSRVLFRWDAACRLPPHGTFVAPAIVALSDVRDLQEEVFGPVLHVVRFAADEIAAVTDAIAANGYGLTLGIQSRIQSTVDRIVARLPTGNVYVNRSMIGAVVGSQPFGGNGLSGTGPKAGGPDYVQRFALEQTISVNTAAAGGNVSLLVDTP